MNKIISNWRTTIADAPHREGVYLELWLDNEHAGEVFVENEQVFIELFSRTEDRTWKLGHKDFTRIIQKIDQFVESMGKSSQ